MDISRADGGGIIGTPLELAKAASGRTGRFCKLSPSDKIAPTMEVFTRSRERESVHNERILAEEAAVEQARPSNLYDIKLHKKQSLTVGDIMDDEDRAQIRLQARTRGRRTAQKVSLEGVGAALIPFAVGASMMPDVIPKAQNSSVGHAILRQLERNHVREGKKSQFANRRAHSDDCYGLAQHLANAALSKSDVKGLGYAEAEDDFKVDSDIKRPRPGKRARLLENRLGREGNAAADDDFDDLANTGYQDLDMAADRMKHALLKHKMRSTKQEQEKSMTSTAIHENDSRLFGGFEKTGIWPERSTKKLVHGHQPPVPRDFAENPYHDSERDPFRQLTEGLCDVLLKEHNIIMERKQEILDMERRSVNIAIGMAKRRREEKLQNIKQQFLVDMSANFVPAQGDVKAASIPVSESSDQGNRVVKIASDSHVQTLSSPGASSRQLKQWNPTSVVCKRFEVEPPHSLRSREGQNVTQSIETESIDDSHGEEDFQIHAIVGADGRRIDFRDADIALIEDEGVVLTTREEEKAIRSRPEVVRPSAELYKAIFDGNASRRDEVEKVTDASLLTGSSASRSGQSQNARTGAHRIKAADFF